MAICSMHGMLLVLFLASSLVHISLSQKVGLDTIKVPGFEVGWTIYFSYSGENIQRVTFSIEDSIGKSLHLALRHNEKCNENNNPELLLNTRTNGRFDSAVIKELTELTISGWSVEAKENHWLVTQIAKSGAVEYEVSFDYRSPHTLSEVNKIRIYGTTCNGGSFEGQLVSLQQWVPASFLQIHIRGRCENPLLSYHRIRFFFANPVWRFMMYSLGKDRIIQVKLPDRYSSDTKELEKPVTTETFDEVILQNMGGGMYKMTIKVGDQETFEYVSDLSSAYDLLADVALMIENYSEITNFEIIY